MKEIWKDIKDYEGIYMISNHGRIKSLERTIKRNSKNGDIHKKETVLNPSVQDDGYYRVTLSKNGKDKRFRIHRLVAEAFIENDDPVNKTCVNHKDEDKANNHVDNLEWCTNEYNIQYSANSGKKFKTKVLCITTNKEFNSIKEANKFYNIKNQSEISRCCKGKVKYAGEYNGQQLEWKYLTNDKTIKKVKCITDGKIFDNCRQAADYYSISDKGISRVCRKERKSYKNRTFEYIE